MAIHTYELYIQETEPQNVRFGVFWYHPSSGIFSMKWDDTNWSQLAMNEIGLGGPNFSQISTISSSIAPATSLPGQIWVQDDINQWVWIGKWMIMMGG